MKTKTRTNAKINWLRMETRIREMIESYAKNVLAKQDPEKAAYAALHLISEIIGDETGRGYPAEDFFNGRPY